MSRRKESKPSIGGPFVPILNDELASTAFQALPPSAAKLYLYFKRVNMKAGKSIPDTTIIFGFTYTEAEKYSFSRHTFSRAVQDLAKHGFIDIIEVGGLRGFGHSCSKYRLSKRWVSFGGLDWARDDHKQAMR